MRATPVKWSRTDGPHDSSSCANIAECRVTHYAFTWTFDFNQRQIACTAALSVEFNPNAECTSVLLDVHDKLSVSSVASAGESLKFTKSKFCPWGGHQLAIELPLSRKRKPGDEPPPVIITIAYSTSGEPAVNWLAPSQTLGNAFPMCYSMGFACCNRALFPCQDTPAVRATFDATFIVPPPDGVDASAWASQLRVACAAGAVTDESRVQRAADAIMPPANSFVALYEMRQSLPPYLIGAFVVGRLAQQDIGPRSAVWAEPELLTAACEEFDGVVETYLQTGERLFGAYSWERYDVIMMYVLDRVSKPAYCCHNPERPAWSSLVRIGPRHLHTAAWRTHGSPSSRRPLW